MRTAISIFSGAGGLDIGLKKAGFDVKLALEIENAYCETLRLNHPELNVVQGDIMKYDRDKIYKAAGLDSEDELDLLFGGSPCQSFSTAGNRMAFEDPRGKAMLKFAELISEIQPKVFLLENVKGFLSVPLKHRPHNQRGEGFPPLSEEERQGSALEFLLKQIEGYNIKYRLLNAADYGVPQTRERVFFVGVRKDLNTDYEFPEPTHSKTGVNGKERWVTFGDLLNTTNFSEHNFVKYTPERLKYMKLIPQGGGNWRDLPESIVKEAMGGAYKSGGGKVGFFRRLWTDRPAPTVLTSPNQKSTNLGHPFEDRPLSVEEYLAIQGFPLDYKVSGSIAKQYIQIGNAVPTHLAKVLGDSILKLLVKGEENREKQYQLSLVF
ncbi:DNA cytosine methyltransferase [Bacillus paralicheniformis]|uniref:DNA cytosine methyltransferase n=1 Tax=Bacillus paralicheniformis TaxID=1648923 RepID=UPI002280D77C|nr:DNA cytosine methyltransferase [Bacillus paralicheniformis]MCY8151105.1 DNA cytosine methyltransferase [Bacillus paralicheniformis]MCY8181298.1 DNA cytosine methyltransferase [Bacillus paralicheniformis]MEC0578572.1 DNA cytosine methyltransferase [Bacillus paralicheniformis]